MRFNDLEAPTPKGAHMAVLQADGVVAGIPPLAIMYLIEKPSDPNKILPVALADIRINHGEHNMIELRLLCTCGKQGCTRRLNLKGRWTGSHTQLFDQQVSKYVSNVLKK